MATPQQKYGAAILAARRAAAVTVAYDNLSIDDSLIGELSRQSRIVG
jgi:hypothetical protein